MTSLNFDHIVVFRPLFGSKSTVVFSSHSCEYSLVGIFRHQNGAVIARASQPEVGWLFWRSKEDEKMIEAIINACKSSADQSAATENNAYRLLIFDARSYAAALANRAKGGGFEYPPYYTNCDVQFMNLPNIHVVRRSSQMLRYAIANAAQGET